MPLEEITPYISDEMMQGRFGEVIGSYTGARWTNQSFDPLANALCVSKKASGE